MTAFLNCDQMRKLGATTLKKYKQVIDEWFVNGFNGKQAYLKIYPNVKDDTATTNFSKVKDLPELKGYIDAKYEKAARVVDATHEGVLKELMNWVEADITETLLLSPEEVKEFPIKIKRLIIKYKVNERDVYNNEGEISQTIRTIEVHFVSKERAIDMINKHIGFYEIDNAQKAATINITASNEADKMLIQNILDGNM